MKVGVRLHFLDSGSFSLWTKAAEWGQKHRRDPYDFYKTKSFYHYMDSYAEFIKKHRHAIDYYANVDAIPNPEVTWRNQLYLEKEHGLDPVPVVHYKTDLAYLKTYIDRGRHRLLALGGLVGSTAQDSCRQWLDRAFDVICDQPSRLPLVRTHGFGVTSHSLLFRYPWFSTDSTAWTMIGGNGGILVPPQKDGGWDFRKPPYLMKFSNTSKELNLAGKHFFTMKKGERAVVLAWLAEIGIPLGAVSRSGKILSYGVVTRYSERKAANLLYFERLRREIPKYPWPFHGPKRATLGIKV